jgi:hypothetical protein
MLLTVDPAHAMEELSGPDPEDLRPFFATFAPELAID